MPMGAKNFSPRRSVSAFPHSPRRYVLLAISMGAAPGHAVSCDQVLEVLQSPVVLVFVADEDIFVLFRHCLFVPLCPFQNGRIFSRPAVRVFSRTYCPTPTRGSSPSSPPNNHRSYCVQTDPGCCRAAFHFFFQMRDESTGESAPSPAGRANYRCRRRDHRLRSYPPASAVSGGDGIFPSQNPGDWATESPTDRIWSLAWCPSSWNRSPSPRASSAKCRGRSAR